MLERSLFLAIRHHPRKIGGDVAQIKVPVEVDGRLNRLVSEHLLERPHASGLAWSSAPPDLAP
jgi:hypothetical protein